MQEGEAPKPQFFALHCSKCLIKVHVIPSAQKRWIMDPSGAIQAAIIDGDSDIPALEVFPDLSFDTSTSSFDNSCVFQFILCRGCSKVLGKLYKSVTTRACAYLDKLVLCKPQIAFEVCGADDSSGTDLFRNQRPIPTELHATKTELPSSGRVATAERPPPNPVRINGDRKQEGFQVDEEDDRFQKGTKENGPILTEVEYFDFHEGMQGYIPEHRAEALLPEEFCEQVSSVADKIAESTRNWSALHSRLVVCEEIYKLIQDVMIAVANHHQKRAQDRSKRIGSVQGMNDKYLR